jgi:glycosyltransferase involved in cell wall biosynthesis
MLRVSHVITGLGVGGAEMMLVKLLGAMDRQRFQSHVISLSSDTALAGAIRGMGIDIDVLDIEPALAGAFSAISRVTRVLRSARPDIVQTWLYHADLVGGIAAKWLRLPVLWNVQTSTLDPAVITPRTIRVVKWCALTSRFVPRVIVSCSHVAVEVHKEIGYHGEFRVIANGTDLQVFKPDADARGAVRMEFGLDETVPVVGMVARLHPQKDHPNFLAAAAQLVRTHPRVRFLLCGLGLDSRDDEITSLIRYYELGGHVFPMGLRHDVPRVLNALDIHTLSSAFGEGFPNVIGEAMATGVPCVVTDVGDSSRIVGDTGVTVPPRDPAALADGWRTLLDLPPAELDRLRSRARQRVAAEFSLAASVAQYQMLYEEVDRRHIA